MSYTAVNFARIVPHGVLVFFPSYPVMHSCVDFWRVRDGRVCLCVWCRTGLPLHMCVPQCTQDNGILQRIEQYKPVFLEPKRKADFNPVLSNPILLQYLLPTFIECTILSYRQWMLSTRTSEIQRQKEPFSLQCAEER